MRAAALRIKIQLETGQAQARVAAQFAKGQGKEGERRGREDRLLPIYSEVGNESSPWREHQSDSGAVYIKSALPARLPVCGCAQGGEGRVEEAIDQGSVDRARRKEVPCINIAQRGDWEGSRLKPFWQREIRQESCRSNNNNNNKNSTAAAATKSLRIEANNLSTASTPTATQAATAAAAAEAAAASTRARRLLQFDSWRRLDRFSFLARAADKNWINQRTNKETKRNHT